MTSDFPPFSYLDTQGKPAGFMTEVLMELLFELKKQGHTEMTRNQIQFFPWKRAYRIASTSSNILMYPLGTVPVEREKLFTWVGPKLTRSIWIYTLAENMSQLRLADKSGLKGKKVGVTRGYSWTDDLEKLGAVLDEAVNDKILVLKLLGNRMPYMAMDEDVLQYISEEVRKENPQYKNVRIEKVVRLSDLGYRTFGVSKTSRPEDVMAIKEAFKKLEASGTIKRILKKYPYLKLSKS